MIALKLILSLYNLKLKIIFIDMALEGILKVIVREAGM